MLVKNAPKVQINMTIDLNRYRRHAKHIIQNMVERENNTNLLDVIGRVSLATECPIIAVAYYHGELYGFTEELNKFIANLVKFYNVTNILNKLD